MKKKSKIADERNYQAYLVWIEPEGDYYFSPEGVCVIGSDQSYTVFSLDSRHNFLRSAVLRFPVVELLGDGVDFKGAQVRLEDLGSFRQRMGLTDSPVKALLRALYEENREQYFYLTRFITDVSRS